MVWYGSSIKAKKTTKSKNPSCSRKPPGNTDPDKVTRAMVWYGKLFAMVWYGMVWYGMVPVGNVVFAARTCHQVLPRIHHRPENHESNAVTFFYSGSMTCFAQHLERRVLGCKIHLKSRYWAPF